MTTSTFQDKVLAAVDDYLKLASASANADDVPYPMIPPLTPEDTTLLPDEFISSMLAVTSPWIDLASPDPAIAHVSRQVFNLEVAYAAFCGVNNIIIEGPRLQDDTVISQYARAIAQALNVGPYLNLQIRLPMTASDIIDERKDSFHLASRAREQYSKPSEGVTVGNPLLAWDAWELLRTVCKFHGRLSVGQ